MRSDRWNSPQPLAVLAVALGLGLGAFALRQTRRGRAFDFHGRSVLITGGSRGLGLVIARQVAAEGARVTIVARDADELERARQILLPAGGDITCIVGDVSRPADAERMVREVVERTGRIDVLINNAGVIRVGPLAHMDAADFEEALGVHFRGPLHAMLTALPVMRRQAFGRIVNIASVGGQVAVPHLAPYCASKFALVGLSDSIRAEVARAGIYVTTVTPGLMRTGSPFNAWFKGQNRREFAWFTIADSLPAVTVSAEAAAAVVVDACRHGDAHRAIGWTARAAAIANAVAPNLVARNMAVMNHWLLPGASERGNAAHSGWQSLSGLAPSWLTRATERAARENNEVPAPPANDVTGPS